MNHQRSTHQFHLPFPQSRDLASSRSFVAQNPTPHVHDSYEPHSSVGLEPVGGEPLVDRMKQPEIAGEPAARADVGFGARLEYIEGAREDEGELERGAQRLVRGLRGEYRYMEWVILCVIWSVVICLEGRWYVVGDAFTFLPITPRQAMDGMIAMTDLLVLT
jgi:hypothetical protein